MLTQEDIKLLEGMFAAVRKEIADTSLKLEGRMVSVEHRLRSVELVTKDIETKTGNLEKNIDILELKIELYNSSLHRKFDKNQQDVVSAIQSVIDGMDDIYKPLAGRVGKIEKHLSI